MRPISHRLSKDISWCCRYALDSVVSLARGRLLTHHDATFNSRICSLSPSSAIMSLGISLFSKGELNHRHST